VLQWPNWTRFRAFTVKKPSSVKGEVLAVTPPAGSAPRRRPTAQRAQAHRDRFPWEVSPRKGGQARRRDIRSGAIFGLCRRPRVLRRIPGRPSRPALRALGRGYLMSSSFHQKTPYVTDAMLATMSRRSSGEFHRLDPIATRTTRKVEIERIAEPYWT